MSANPGISPPKKILYCIAYEERRKGKLYGEKLYVHAADEQEARYQYFISEQPAVIYHRKVVGIAPVIGHFVNDNHGDDLSVD